MLESHSYHSWTKWKYTSLFTYHFTVFAFLARKLWTLFPTFFPFSGSPDSNDLVRPVFRIYLMVYQRVQILVEVGYRIFFSKSLSFITWSYETTKKTYFCHFSSADGQKTKMVDFWCKNCLSSHVELLDFKILSIKWVILTSGM